MLLRLQRGLSLLQILVALALLSFGLGFYSEWYAHEYPCKAGGYTICARTSELILAAYSAKGALAEGMRTHHTWSQAWLSAITFAPSPVLERAGIAPNGEVRVQGTAIASHATVTLTPQMGANYTLTWTCKGEPVKYMPASCR